MSKFNQGIGWFSGGATSALAIKKALEAGKYIQIYYFETGQHHPDHARFLADCEKWYGQKINILKNRKYESPLDVCLKDKYVNGPTGARCTLKLKKELRQVLEKFIEYDFQIFGFEYDKKEINRAIRFSEQYPEAKGVFPLIELGLTKQDALAALQEAGIELPAMYRLGYNNSNCIGCVKGGMGYWNKVRRDFPDVFNATAEMERKIGRSCIKGKFLDELDPTAGRHEDVSLPECGVVCPTELDGLEEIHDTSKLPLRLFEKE